MTDPPGEVERLRRSLSRAEKRIGQLERRGLSLDRFQQVNATVQRALLRDMERAQAVLEARRREVEADLEQARAFQRALLPIEPDHPTFQVASWYGPAEVVGGDVYDLCVRDDTPRIFLGDTTGHGILASLRTMVVKTLLDRLRSVPGGPEVLLGELNDSLVGQVGPMEVRLSARCLDLRATPRGMEAVSAHAGAPPWILARHGDLAEIYAPGPFVGMLDGAGFPQEHRGLRPGDRLFLATDGLHDQPGLRSPRLPEGGLSRALAGPESAPGILAEVRALFDEHRGSLPVLDDVTAVAVTVR